MLCDSNDRLCLPMATMGSLAMGVMAGVTAGVVAGVAAGMVTDALSSSDDF